MMTTDDILGTPISTAASDLLRTVRSLSEAPVQFRFGTEQELGGQSAALAKSRTQADGSAEIVLPRDFDECMLAHEILHVALKRRGIPQVVKWAHLDGPFPLLGALPH